MKTAEDYKNGQVLLIDKPLEWTSFQVVNKLRWHIRKHFNIKKIKVGHAGTLDPLATGLLIICTGKQTKNINEYQGQVKEYTGTITLGATTPSYDLETEVNEIFPIDHITSNLIHNTTNTFIGKIHQKPPIFSAIKKEGKRLYELARKGETTEIKSREVEITEFEITKIDFPKVDFRVVCSKGTYIRSLAYDFGLALNSGAHLSALRRTKIGNFSTENAKSIDQFIESL
ncbi:tRNA pseudouridine(55) synthase TruB [Tenacibaculum maritimum]|uniref:tRNA pseudouridine(55) synthase TruB n=1 Tax=Tenacibaculum maritimum TaxID=107401 RepID=UPI0010A49CAE|nr:tRNA pseudouridine(55) synthase TruB [Tenacibaculum maritimum]MCD9561901.1 tRNA pseudouridine(55) synthase TruB [Tenacibaculum maritimum]MCD9564985.1 tRNA pseudouridine(55) synthase TruB [Tenacibaculum maritimum]MCD9578958.1 tRNA pseudouridine(55) synthase TruB [Tenacibaculum maritimum]MCD9580868.1 tRNA pseudouridine(55) synthase TruB [Tenacibaculum maritimum]MCD9595812.1 tRNA pseudouridine(55) synthase TruB [Tenacibaculum maritimum]